MGEYRAAAAAVIFHEAKDGEREERASGGTDVKITLTDGGFHAADSSQVGFEVAAKAAFRQTMPKAGPERLEPIMKVDVYDERAHQGRRAVNVLVDTSVWSLSLRRAKRVDDSSSKELSEQIREGRVVMIGLVRQDLLSGIKTSSQFDLLRDHLRAFSDLALEAADYEEAADAFNRCGERGIQGSNTDFLVCSVALRRDLAVYTEDKDFLQYAKVLRLKLHKPRT